MLISIDLTSRKPIYEQLKENILRLAVLGLLEPNEQLPSVRSLARELTINPNTVQKAYQELERDGYVYSSPGRGSFISEGVAKSARLQNEATQLLIHACNACKLVNINKEDAVSIVEEAYREGKAQ